MMPSMILPKLQNHATKRAVINAPVKLTIIALNISLVISFYRSIANNTDAA
jgi:hypothetical protein